MEFWAKKNLKIHMFWGLDLTFVKFWGLMSLSFGMFKFFRFLDWAKADPSLQLKCLFWRKMEIVLCLFYDVLVNAIGKDDAIEILLLDLALSSWTILFFLHVSERPIRKKLMSADTDNRPHWPILSADNIGRYRPLLNLKRCQKSNVFYLNWYPELLARIQFQGSFIFRIV